MGEPYVKVPLSILTSDLKPQSKLLFAYMLNFRNMNGNWKALCKSAKELGEALKIPATTIQRSIAELESRGLIEVQKGHVSSYLVQPTMGQDQPTMGQDQPTMGQDQPTMGQPYTFIYKRNNKRNIKEKGEKRARTREQLTYDADLFVKKKAEGGNK